MKVVLQTIICWCVLVTVVALVKGNKVDLNSNFKKSIFRVWLQSRTRGDLQRTPAVHRGFFSRPEQREGTDPSVLHLRSRRSGVTTMNRPGCSLGTCIMQDLIHKVHHLNDSSKVNKAPEKKIGAHGYGRRRRSPLTLPHNFSTRFSGREDDTGIQL
ncbi:ADM isoform X2 [Esox lucius]|uniref:Uncharacterized protein n=2 Tax=Esox lucius TaxID=8010 RepID=A0AAY5JWL2_ESOLU|nr:ADM isoform X2 [Esox lucius]